MRSRLPERFRHLLPPALTAFAIGLASALLFFLARVAVDPLVGGLVPYVFAFVAVTFGCLFGGWRAGLVTFLIGHVLIQLFLVEPRGTLIPADSPRLWAFLFSALAALAILLILALYQREIDRHGAEREARIGRLGEERREVDHRTTNNFQNMLALLRMQAAGAVDPAVRAALDEAAGRIRAVALTYEKLIAADESRGDVHLDDYLDELCDQLRHGLLGERVRLDCAFAAVTVPADTAFAVGAVVNELITNALKHAFADEGGVITASTRREGGALVLTVADDGRGIAPGRGGKGTGLGTRIVQGFVKKLAATHRTASGAGGTVHTVTVPMPA